MKPHSAILLFVCLLGLTLGMYWAWDFVGPRGQTMTASGFITLFFREFLVLGIFVVLLIYLCFDWLRQRMRSLFSRHVDK